VRVLILAASLLSLSCGREVAPPVALRVEPGSGGTRLTLTPNPGWRINALLPPAFEQADGSVIRFGSDTLTPDSAYYLAPPTGTLPDKGRPLRGTLRASVCAAGEQVCRPYVERVGS
jgi:hypothetical protein